MQNIVDALNNLKSKVDTEITLRQAANQEFSNGIKNGVMKQAHDRSIEQVVEASKNLIAISG